MISFDFGESDPIGVKTMRLLNQYGEVNATGLTLKKIFQNDRIYIEGVLNAEVKYQDLYIAIKLKTGEQSPTPENFGLPKKNIEETTGVYLWNRQQPGFPQFIRPGRWMKYIDQLYNKLIDELDKATEHNQKPIDDSELFPDLE
jgi:hypothetical protein